MVLLAIVVMVSSLPLSKYGTPLLILVISIQKHPRNLTSHVKILIILCILYGLALDSTILVMFSGNLVTKRERKHLLNKLERDVR